MPETAKHRAEQSGEEKSKGEANDEQIKKQNAQKEQEHENKDNK